jgi:hypothetical protein
MALFKLERNSSLKKNLVEMWEFPLISQLTFTLLLRFQTYKKFIRIFSFKIIILMETTNSEIRHEKDGRDIHGSIATQLKGRHTGCAWWVCTLKLFRMPICVEIFENVNAKLWNFFSSTVFKLNAFLILFTSFLKNLLTAGPNITFCGCNPKKGQ